MSEMNSIGLVELTSIAAGYLAGDAMLKASDVTMLLSRSICSGKYIVMDDRRVGFDRGDLPGEAVCVQGFER